MSKNYEIEQACVELEAELTELEAAVDKQEQQQQWDRSPFNICGCIFWELFTQTADCAYKYWCDSKYSESWKYRISFKSG